MLLPAACVGVPAPTRRPPPVVPACATPASAAPVIPLPGGALGTEGVAARQLPPLLPLIDASQWEALEVGGLLELLIDSEPPSALSQVLQYCGADLFAATPLPEADLLLEYARPSEAFVAGQGFVNQAMWLELAGGNLELQRWVRDGYSEYIVGEVPRVVRANNPNTADHTEFVGGAVADLVSVGAVEVVTQLRGDPGEVACICPLTVAVQGSGKLRLCWNGRPVNGSMPVQQFKLEHIQVALGLVQPGDMLFTIDMQAGYHQVPVKPWMRKLLCFEWAGQVYRWRVLPFGLSSAPRAYSKLGRALLKRWRSMGIRCSNYIDDFFFAAKPADVLLVRGRVLADLTNLGWYISAAKCMLQPGTAVKYLGFVVCSLPVPHVRIPDAKIAKLRESLRGILRRGRLLPVQQDRSDQGELADCEVAGQGAVRVKGRTLARLLGFMQSFRVAIPIVAVATKALQTCVAGLPLTVQGWLDYGSSVELSVEALLECRFWYHKVSVWNGAVIKPGTVSRVLYTDASGQGYGGVLHRVANRVVEPALQVQSGFWESCEPTASVSTELKGLWRALVAAGSELVGQNVLHRTDSISTYYILRKGGCRSSRELDVVASRILVYCAVQGVALSSQYVGADVIIVSGADALSRRQDESDCRLHPELFGKLCSVFGEVQVGRFATAASAQWLAGRRLPYWGLWADGLAAGMDGLSGDWRGLFNYAFPPVALVGRVLQLVSEQQARVLLIAPKWPSQWWWPQLQAMAAIVVDLHKIHVGELFLPTRAGGLPHPLGAAHSSPHTVEWVAAYIPGV